MSLIRPTSLIPSTFALQYTEGKEFDRHSRIGRLGLLQVELPEDQSLELELRFCPRVHDMLTLPPTGAPVQVATQVCGSSERGRLSVDLADEISSPGSQVLFWGCSCGEVKVAENRHSVEGGFPNGKCFPDVCGACNEPARKLGVREAASLATFKLGTVHASYVAGITVLFTALL